MKPSLPVRFPAAAQLVLALALVLAPEWAPAQPAAGEIPAPRFNIERFEAMGNTLLPAVEIERVVAPYTGKGRDFSDIQRALETLEQAYRDRGYGVVQVSVPEQDITRGVVRIRVVQPRVDRVLIEGNAHFDAANVRRSLPTVREGETPNSKEIALNLQLAAEHPVKQTTVLLRSAASEDLVDVNIKIADDKPWRAFFTLDNTGTSDTGNLRTGFGYQHSNLFNRDHSLTAQYVTSPTQPEDVTLFGAGYRIPFYGLNSSLDLIAGYSDVNSGVVQGLFNVSGSGTIGAARWNWILPRWGETEQKLALGLDYRAFRNEVLFQGQPQVPDITIHPLSVTYSSLLRMSAAEFSAYAGVAANIPGGDDGQQDDFERSRAGASAKYTILRYGLNYTRQFRSEWQMRLGLNGQHTGDALVSGEQYGIGGPDSVRGYLVREVSNDYGYSSQIELYTPDFARRIGLPDTYKTRLVGFYDWGTVRRNDARPGEVQRDSIASTGIGLRATYGKALNLRLDFAYPLQETVNRDNNSLRVSGALALVY